MHRTVLFLSTLTLVTAPGFAQSGSSDSQVTQALLTEVRQLRQDLQTTAATIQRAQIVMYRLQSETSLLDHATERLDSVRARCNQLQEGRKQAMSEIEEAETRPRNVQSPFDRKGMEALASQLAGEEQQCQNERVDADAQFRTEQARMNDFQDQLNKLDAALAAAADGGR